MRNGFALFLLCFPMAAMAVGGVTSLPEGVRQRLNEEYPGWRLAPVNKAVWEDFKKAARPDHPNILSADFDKDGKPDWAIQIALVNPGEEEQFVTVFLQRDGGFEEAIVESRGLDPAVYIIQRYKTFSEMVSGKDQLSKRTELVILGGPMGDSGYYWEGGQFREAPPELPGSALPPEPATP